MNLLKRRTFCQSFAHLGIMGAVSLSKLRYAVAMEKATQNPSQEPQFFILVRVENGWDTSLAMDPWNNAQRPQESDYFIEYREDELLPFGSSFVGPAMKPLQAYFARMTVVNGIFMTASDLGHEALGRYAETGSGQGDLGILPFELEGRVLDSRLGTLANSAPYSGPRSRATWGLSTISSSQGGSNSQALNDPTVFLDLNERATDLNLSRQALLKSADRIQIFNETVRQQQSHTQSHFIAAAFRSRLSASAYLHIRENSIDTHNDHAKTHLSALTKVMENIRDLIGIFESSPGVGIDGKPLESKSLLDQTTMMVVSEFTRTPALNNSKGKDHNPQSNSAILMGPGLKGSTVIGGSTLVTRAHSRIGVPYLAGLPLDIETEKPVRRRENIFILHPESVVATVAQSMGCSPSSISQTLGAARTLKSILK